MPLARLAVSSGWRNDGLPLSGQKNFANPFHSLNPFESAVYLCGPFARTDFSLPLDMLIVQIKDNETVDRALKRFKKKFERTGVLKELRRRTFFQKPSITKRKLKQKAVYKLATYGGVNE